MNLDRRYWHTCLTLSSFILVSSIFINSSSFAEEIRREPVARANLRTHYIRCYHDSEYVLTEMTKKDEFAEIYLTETGKFLVYFQGARGAAMACDSYHVTPAR